MFDISLDRRPTPITPSWNELLIGQAIDLMLVIGLVFLLCAVVRRRADFFEAFTWIGGSAFAIGFARAGLTTCRLAWWYATGGWSTETWDQIGRDFAYVERRWFPFALLGAVCGLLFVIYRIERCPPHRRRTGRS